MDQSEMDHETWINQKPARKIFSCHPERSKFLRSRKNVRSRKTPQYRRLPLTASGTNQKSGGQIFSCHPERSKFLRSRRNFRSRRTATPLASPHRLREFSPFACCFSGA